MITWAMVVGLIGTVVALVSSDLSSVVTGVAELAAVTALFALVCAAEAFN